MSGFAITGILNQYDAFGVLRPLNFYSRKSSLAEWNYDTDDPELLAIVESQKQWWHFLEGANYEVSNRWDHKNLQ